jgi:GntR family transcriptional regulator
MTTTEDFSVPLYDMIEKKYGIIAKTSFEDLKAISADRNLTEKLNVKEGDSILVRKRFVYDENEIPPEFNKGY